MCCTCTVGDKEQVVAFHSEAQEKQCIKSSLEVGFLLDGGQGGRGLPPLNDFSLT